MNLELLSRLPTQNITLNLTNFIWVEKGEGMDPMDPAFREAVISHSLLKEGGVLALQNLKAKELIFPLRLKANTSSGVATLIKEIHEVLATPGATCIWQDDGMSQATTFDVISGQFDVEYNYREAQRHFLLGKLRVFTEPFGRAASPRAYAAASGVGPLLMISPYGSGGALTIGASTQAGVEGFGGKQQPSGGVFYQGAPSLIGDAPAKLQISYTGPLPNTATNAGVVPNVAVSILPDQYYQPLVGVSQIAPDFAAIFTTDAGAVGSSYWRGDAKPGIGEMFSFHAPSAAGPNWAGNHRLFAIARASEGGVYIKTVPGPFVQFSTVASVPAHTDWGLYDLGTISLRASQANQITPVTLFVSVGGSAGGGATESHFGINALIMLPDSPTWFFNVDSINMETYGFPLGVVEGSRQASGVYTNTFILDDIAGDQFLYGLPSQVAAPPPVGYTASSARITQYARGLLPRPQPYTGMPIIAVLGLAKPGVSPITSRTLNNAEGTTPGASWVNPQTKLTTAQVNVLERTSYVLP